MKKIGILTFHNADNLGAVLQAYALQRVLAGFTERAEIIDYRCPEIEAGRKITLGKNPKSWVKGILLGAYRGMKHRAFSAFRKAHLICSRQSCTAQTIGSLSDGYDVLIAGSDQIWNLGCSGYDEAYFLNFASGDRKCVSYAASMGAGEFTQEQIRRITGFLRRFDQVSVREPDAARQLAGWGIEAQVHPDPVFLLTRQQWEDLMPGRLCRKPYVLVYMIRKDPALLEKARAYARARGCRLISNKHSLAFILGNSPARFLSWVCHAECVFTNSFHGTAFSCMFDKPLAAEVNNPDGEVNGRILNLLTQADAEACILRDDRTEIIAPAAEEALQKLRAAGLEYLRKVCR